MSLSHFLVDVGHPVAYYPKLARMLGSVNAAVFLCQLLYWTDKTQDGWIYKTQPEIEEETGLTRRKQETVRTQLVDKEILAEARRGSHGTLHFRVDTIKLDALWSEWLKTPMAESANDECTKPPNANGGKRQSIITESTTETTSESTDIKSGFLPGWLDPKVWARWVVHKAELKNPMTLQQAQAQIKKLETFRARGMPPEEIIENSIANGWRGFFELKGYQNGKNGNRRQGHSARADGNPPNPPPENQGTNREWAVKNRV